MNVILIIVFLVYLLVFLFILGFSSILSIIVFLEVLSWIFVIVIPTNLTLSYLIIQSYFLLLSLIRMLSVPVLLATRLCLKLGIPPFHMWFLRLARRLKNVPFIFLMTIHKLTPILLLSKIVFSSIAFVFLRVVLLIIMLCLLTSITLFFTLVFSSMLNSLWISLRILVRKSFLFIYWAIYRTLLIFLVFLLSFKKLDQSSFIQRFFSSSCWLLISGIPPFIIFWVKVYVLVWFLFSFGLNLSLFLIIRRVITLTAYFRTWHSGRLIELRSFSRLKNVPFILLLTFWSIFYIVKRKL